MFSLVLPPMRSSITYLELQAGDRHLVARHLAERYLVLFRPSFGIRRCKLPMPASACRRIVLASTSPAAAIWSSSSKPARICSTRIGSRCKRTRSRPARPVSVIRNGRIIPPVSTAFVRHDVVVLRRIHRTVFLGSIFLCQCVWTW